MTTRLSGLFDAFFSPVRSDNTGTDQDFGNQTAALTSQFVFPTAQPFAVYFQYAGEDGSRKEGWRLGNAALSAGLDLPRLWNRFDLTYEVTEWQNGWYVHHIYPAGQSNDGHVIGHWGGDDRVRGDGVGAQSHSLRVGWMPPFGGRAELRYRTLQNEDYSAFDYEREHELSLRYSRSTHAVRVRRRDQRAAGMSSARTSGASAGSCVSCRASPSPASASRSRARRRPQREFSSSSMPG